ncbi:MAG: hypothetical protein PHI71_18505 [Acidiphilium sp.]|nr:hypothetical protein [Acidiphilium sp.]
MPVKETPKPPLLALQPSFPAKSNVSIPATNFTLDDIDSGMFGVHGIP